MERSVVVVGAGIIGCAIARDLARRGLRCTIVDDRGVAGGATRASAGMLAPYVEAHEDGPLLGLAVRSLHLYPDWIAAVRRESGVDVEFAATGTLEVAASEESAAALRRACAAHGRWLDADALRAGYPQVGRSLGGRLTPEHGFVVPPQLAAALALAAERHGVAMHQGRVVGVQRAGLSFRVETTTGLLEADVVVVAAGAWTNGIGGIRTPPIKPVRGQIVELAWPGQMLPSIVWGPGCYVVPRRDGTILVGATVEDAGYAERTTAQGVRDLLAAACELLPAAGEASFLDARAGLRPVTPDALPVLGEDPATPGVFHASGHYRNGVLLAPITATLIGDAIVEGRRDPCLESFRVDRFS